MTDPILEKLYSEIALKADLPEHEFPDEIALLSPLGAKIVCLRAPTLDKFGELYIPDNAKPVMNCGWIVRAGPQATTAMGFYNETAEASYSDPLPVETIIGTPVMWGRWMGGGIPVYAQEQEFKCKFILMQADELWAVASEKMILNLRNKILST